LDAAVSRIEGAVADQQRMAANLVGVWRYEYGQGVDSEESMSLARELWAGNLDAFEEWKSIRAAEAEHLQRRAQAWLADMPAAERRRWTPLLDSAIVGIEPDWDH
jgi:hypothetical protein